MTIADLERKIRELERKNDTLARENKYLKKLTSSKRFRFAEKIATTYNVFFPVSTKRRIVFEGTGRGIKNILTINKKRKIKKNIKKITELAKNYKKVIVLNSIPYDIKLKQRPHHLADEFSKKGFFVVYLEYDNPVKPFRIIKDNLITVNSELYITTLPSVCKNCYFLSPNNMPTDFATLEYIRDLGYKIIYDYLDEFHEDIAGDLSIQREVWDKLNLLKPVLCLATAKRLYDDLRNHLGKHQKIIIARNAVNIEHFDFTKNETKIPPFDIKSVVDSKKPIVGFYGALAAWIDFELLNQLANNHPEWEFVYLGIDYNGAAADLKITKNVHNLGAKNYESLPKYTKFFSCAIIPFRKGEIAKATSPVKLFEYMAAGLPTICTRDLQECEGFDYVYMAKDDAEFEKNIAEAIKAHDDIKARRKLLVEAKENTWEARVRDITEALK